jgi:Sec-independent protein translocase protein TatA
LDADAEPEVPMRTASLVVLILAPMVLGQEKAPATRRVVEPASRRTPEEMAEAERRASEKQRENWKLDQEFARVSKFEPEPKMPPFDSKATKAQRDRDIDNYMIARRGWLEREKLRKARLAELTEQREQERASPTAKSLQEMLRKQKAEEEAAKLNKEADREAAIKNLEAWSADIVWKTSTAVGIKRRVLPGREVPGFKLYTDCMAYRQFRDASDWTGASAHVARSGIRYVAGSEFIVVADTKKDCKVRITTSESDLDVVWLPAQEIVDRTERCDVRPTK